MTKMNPEQEGLAEEVSRQWVRHKAEKSGIEARIRKKVKAEMAEFEAKSALEVAESIRVALEGGVTRVALKKVTSKNPGALEAFIKLLQPKEVVEAEATPFNLAALKIKWFGKDMIEVRLDPRLIEQGSFDRNDLAPWSDVYDVFVREDGVTFIDPIVATSNTAVTEWMRADPAHLALVVAWVGENAPSE